MVALKYVPLIAAFPIVLHAEKFFVRLKSPEVSMETFLRSDELVRIANHAKPFIEQSFAFGDFAAFVGDFSKDMLKHLSQSKLVLDITPDIIIKAMDDVETQSPAPRHLARLSQLDRLPPPGAYQSLDYFYDSSNTGEGVYAYVIDSGVRVDHPEFEGRAVFGKDFTGEGSGDFNGHGTHVAGIIGSKTYGVAKDITIVDVKALDFRGSGSLSGVVGALEYAVNHRLTHGNRGVANLSLGAARNSVLNLAIKAAYESGLVIIAAAGNSNIDACITSPGGLSHALTVGAIDDKSDQLASFTNWGSCVDVFASGVYVYSLSNLDVKKLVALSGTSMASPVVAGLAGTLLGAGVAPEDIKQTVVDLSSEGYISRRSVLLRPFTPNRIAFNRVTEEHSDSAGDSEGEE
ncbi:hypothetical protein BABINDRAFT_31173 [Babjeviella inositovora NRRL Y-12698]|uniref:Peptidase S8/S53 domain-containing protein n=1 Tax=Babjeviella inositovora NRRL Y-12698 TaxID=984486 RepID=A0A1E3QZG0_9ASCO|nr:uncharacterized protein BABINDRAFT_31173 [Babjeviella inositovora NRRL Y-12698]ODQ82477.1 hypothetical protein BABINDRAFT_31173 [Babjeviella inositovora NRRL Y-12698]